MAKPIFGSEADANIFYKESADDDVGLWEITRLTKERLVSSEALQKEVFNTVRALLARGLLAMDLTRGGGFEPWPEQQPDLVISRIQREWDELGETPSIGDIVWFHLPR